MGKSLSKDRNYEEYLLLHKKIESAKDIHYGDIDVMESLDKKQIIAMKDRKFQNLEKLREQLGQIRKRRDNTHPNFVQVLEYFVMSEDNFCTSISRLIWTMEYIKKDLTVEIRQRKLQQIPFEVSEIKQIAFASISAFANLQRDGIYFNDIRAQNILLTNSLEVKILDPVVEPNPPLLIQVLHSFKPKKGTYLAPNFLKLAKQKNILHKLTTHKSESFSLGFVLMEACLLNEQDECFDFAEGTINLQNYKKNIQQIQDTYGEEISSMIKEMTNFNEKQRLDFIQLELKYNLNTKLDKPLQSSQFLNDYSSSKLPTSQSQLKINGDQSLSQISHLDQNKKSVSQKKIRPLRQFDLLNKNQSKEAVNTDRSNQAKEKSYFCKNNYQTLQLQKIMSLNVDHKNLPNNNSFVSNAESFIPFIQNLDSNQNLKEKQTPLNKNRFQQQNNISENKQTLKQNNLRFDQATTPRHSISFVHQENFENYNQNTLNVNKQDAVKESEKNINEFKKNTKLQDQLQNFYSNMRSQNDKSILNNTLKLHAKSKSISQTQRSLLQSMRIDQAGDDKENFNSSNAEILKCLKDESNIDNNQDAQTQNQNVSHESVYLDENNVNNQNNQSTPQEETNNDNTSKRQLQRNSKNKSYDSACNLIGNNLNPISEDQNEKYQKSSPQLQISVTADGDMISAIDPQSTTTTKQQSNQNQINNLNSLNKKFFNISEIKFEGNGNQYSNTTNFMNTKSSVVPYQTNNQQQSFFNQSHYQTSFIEAQSIYIQQRSNSQVIEVIEETYEDGSVYSGEKFKGKRHGNGKFFYADGGLYEGSWFDGCMEGYGKLYYPSGKLAYEGEWKRDKFTGQGIVYNDTPEELGENQSFDYADFDKMGEHWIQYEGGFLDDLKQGQGILYLPNGNRFIGGFLNDMVEGIGIFVTSEGKEIKAHYSQNKLLKLL
ncbi:hypothetical protein ABPG72_004201 [Tetrahymena utriculariae]